MSRVVVGGAGLSGLLAAAYRPSYVYTGAVPTNPTEGRDDLRERTVALALIASLDDDAHGMEA